MTTQAQPGVLVTGASGYVGKLTVAALAERRDELGALVALDVVDVPAAQRLEGVTYVAADICDAALGDLMKSHEVTTVVHLASIIRVPKGAPADLAWRVDVEGTRNVLEACRDAGATRLIVTSSGAAYGYYPDNPEWIDEDDALRGNEDFPYAHHKKVVEQMLAQWREQLPGLEQVIFRPGTVIGESVHSPITDLFEKRAVIGIAGSRSPFVFIWDQDVVDCLIAAVFGGPTGIYNLAGDGAMSPQQIATRLGKPYLPLPAPLVGAVLFLLKSIGLTEHGPERVKFLRYRPVLKNDRLKERFGFVPANTSLEAFELYARARGLLA